MLKFGLMVVSCVALLGCVSLPDETPGGKAVKIMQGDVPADCVELKSVDWHGAKYHSLTDVKTALREKTAALGGNVLRLEGIGSSPEANGVGTAYKCPSQ
jgi:hypothetical protein